MTKPTSDMKVTLLDIDVEAKRYRVGAPSVAIVALLVFGFTDKSAWSLPLAIPPAIIKLLGRGK